MALPSTITLAVDELNNLTLVNEALSHFETTLNRSTYIGELHTALTKDQLAFYRTAHKSNGNFRGTDKTSFKFTREVIVDGVDGVSQLTVPLIFEVSASIPVGVSAADMLLMRQRCIALLDLDTVMVPFQTQLMI